jgi:lysyl oxidase
MDAYEGGVAAPVGALEYSIAYGHNHWHYLALDRYDLLPHDPSVAADGLADTLGRDQKSGFCLENSTGGNGFNLSQCQYKNPSALSLTGTNSEEIKPGEHDIYEPDIDGQYIDVTGLLPANGAPPVYRELVEWVNADCRMAEPPGSTGNNTWSVVVKFWTDGSGPHVATTGDPTYWSQWFANHPGQQCLPQDTVRPQISGSATTGSIVSAAPGSWLIRMATGFSSPFLYQWRRCNGSGWDCDDTAAGNGNISGATSANYVPTSADIGHTLRVRVTGQFPGTTEQQTPEDSSATPVVAAGPPPAPPLPPSPPATPGTPHTTPDIPGLTAALMATTHLSVHDLLLHGLHARAHCSQACRVQFNLLGPGAITLAKSRGLLRKAGSHTYTIRLTRRMRRVVSHYHGGTLMLWLHVRTRDNQQQTLSRVVHLTG